jgi:glycosyltransferase involved in cell wall biosynthesis
MQIVAVALVKNEDQFIESVLRNASEFCDLILVADNGSTDGTAEILSRMSRSNPKLEIHRVRSPSESHVLVQRFAGTPTWVFGVDGDEIYDPAGLAVFRKRLEGGEFDDWWVLFGNVLNCLSLDRVGKMASGYLAPPCRSMTKLYNFSAIHSWDGPCTERLHDGIIRFKDGFSSDRRYDVHKDVTWESAEFRCLHTCFLPRSSLDDERNREARVRPNIADRNARPTLSRFFDWVFPALARRRSSGLKRDKYMRGELVTKDVSAFFPQ